jgi:hypothetical protein
MTLDRKTQLNELPMRYKKRNSSQCQLYKCRSPECRDAEKNLPGTNTLAYSAAAATTNTKRFLKYFTSAWHRDHQHHVRPCPLLPQEPATQK